MKQNILSRKIKVTVLFVATSGLLLLGQFICALSAIKIATSRISLPQHNVSLFVLNNFETLLFVALFIVFAYFLKKKKKWAWFATMVLLLKEIVDAIRSIPLFFFGTSYLEKLSTVPKPLFNLSIISILISVLFYISILISLVLLILERKEYLQIKLRENILDH